MAPRSAPTTRLVPTPLGDARLLIHPAEEPLALLVLGHGASGGAGGRDLVALANALPSRGITVVRLEQPWRVAGKRVAPQPPLLDRAWLAAVPEVAAQAGHVTGDASASAVAARAPLPLFLGGRSAGARVACRTATALGAAGVLALAFPLHPPGRPERSRAGELVGAGVPVLVMQGERDSFGRPEELPPGFALHVVPGADHSMVVGASAVPSQQQVLADLCAAAGSWVLEVARAGNGRA